jgi:hypothetical protein
MITNAPPAISKISMGIGAPVPVPVVVVVPLVTGGTASGSSLL